MSIILKLCVCVVLLCISPLIWLWMLIDYPRLKRAAMDVEPLVIPPAKTVWDRIIDVTREMLFVLVLPLIAIVGMFMAVFSDDSDRAC